MAFDFNSIKDLPSSQRNARIFAHQIRCFTPFYQLDEKRDEAKTRGNLFLAVYYIFLERLYKAVAPKAVDEVPDHLKTLLNEPDDLIKGMETLLQQYRTYHVEDADKLHNTIGLLKFFRQINPDFFD